MQETILTHLSLVEQVPRTVTSRTFVFVLKAPAVCVFTVQSVQNDKCSTCLPEMRWFFGSIFTCYSCTAHEKTMANCKKSIEKSLGVRRRRDLRVNIWRLYVIVVRMNNY